MHILMMLNDVAHFTVIKWDVARCYKNHKINRKLIRIRIRVREETARFTERIVNIRHQNVAMTQEIVWVRGYLEIQTG